MVDKYYVKSRLNILVYELGIHPGNAKERLIRCLSEYWSFMRVEFPENLHYLFDRINDKIKSKGKTDSLNAFEHSLKNKRNSSCSDIIKDIWLLMDEYGKYLSYKE